MSSMASLATLGYRRYLTSNSSSQHRVAVIDRRTKDAVGGEIFKSCGSDHAHHLLQVCEQRLPYVTHCHPQLTHTSCWKKLKIACSFSSPKISDSLPKSSEIYQPVIPSHLLSASFLTGVTNC